MKKVRRPVRLLALKAQTKHPLPGDGRGCLLGGDGGSRTRVRKHIPANFYERSRSMNIPSPKRRTAGFPAW